MRKIMITGAGGFVASHFLQYLAANPSQVEVYGVGIVQPPQLDFPFHYETAEIDMLDEKKLENYLLEKQPDEILHLASVSSVGISWQNPASSFMNNTNIFLNLLEPIRRNKLKTRVLSVGSSEEYGIVDAVDLPLRETHSTKPESPYGVARVAQEDLSRVFAKGYALDIVMTRSFNHIGPRQREDFVVASFIKQAVQAKLAGKKQFELRAGNIEVVRDFLDVRDVVKAYHLLLVEGKSGEVYNICSGKGTSLVDIVHIIAQTVDIEIDVKRDRSLYRPSELLRIVGSNDKMLREHNWVPTIPIEESIRDMVKHLENSMKRLTGFNQT